MSRFFLALLIAAVSTDAALGGIDEIKLRIGDEIAWKQFFDAGFRPHHVMDGKSFCRQFDVKLSVSSGGSAQWLDMNRGDAFFDLAEDDLVLGFHFDTTDSLSAQEAQSKLDRFEVIFRDNIKAGFGGVIEYNKAENRYNYGKSSSRADLKNWRVTYSLTASYQEVRYPQPPREQWKPFIERISIVYRGDQLNRIVMRDKPIKPPVGYESVSLAAPSPQLGDGNSPSPFVERKPRPLKTGAARPAFAERSRRDLGWILTGGLGLLIAVIIIKWKLRRNS